MAPHRQLPMSTPSQSGPPGFDWDFNGLKGGLVRSVQGARPNRGRGLFSTFATEPLVVTFYGRLHYLSDHLQDLPKGAAIRDASDQSRSAAEIVAGGYESAGLQWLSRLEGDYCFVVWDRVRGLLVLQRDPLGGYALFWGGRGRRRVVSTSLRRLSQALLLSELNPEYIAEFLTPGPLRQELLTSACVWKGARRVQPGEQWVINLHAGDEVRTGVWRWTDHLDFPQGSTLPEIADEFRARLLAAVRERLSARTVVHVSGGLDSTGVAAICRQLVTDAGGVEGVALVFDAHPRLAWERKLVAEAARALEPLPVHLLPADQLLNFSGLLTPPSHDEPYQGLWQIEAERALVEHAAQRGATSILTGLGGDELADNTPFELVDLIRSGRLLGAWKRARQVAAVWSESPWGVLWPYGVQVAGQLVRSRWGWRRLSGRVPFGGLPGWIRPEAIRRWNLQDRAWEAFQSVYGKGPSTLVSVALSGVQSRAGNFGRGSLAAIHGMELSHPLLDPRVIGLGLGIREQRPMPAGVQKPLLREVFHEHLPQSILERNGKGNFDELYFRGLVDHRRALQQLIVGVSPMLEEWFHPGGLSQELERVALGGMAADQLRVFDSVLSLLGWFSQLD